MLSLRCLWFITVSEVLCSGILCFLRGTCGVLRVLVLTLGSCVVVGFLFCFLVCVCVFVCVCNSYFSAMVSLYFTYTIHTL